jgi:hypothetical protein
MKKSCFVIFAFLCSLPFALAMSVDWQKAESKHFIVYYKNAGKDFVKTVIEKSEQYYDNITKNLGLGHSHDWAGEKRAKIYICDNREQYHANTGQPVWSDGSVIMRLRVIYSFLGAKKFFETALPHEMAHIIFREIVGFDNRYIPSWLEEGFAAFQENVDLAKAERGLKASLDKGSFIALPKLSEMKVRLNRDESQIDLFYKESLSIVHYLITKFGTDKFLLFCQNLRDNKNLEKALKRVYNFNDIQELDKVWQSSLLQDS